MGDRVRDHLERVASEEGRPALIVFLPAGYPDLETSRACLAAAARAGADVLEVGFPFSDPIMDGPTIQAANQATLERGYRVDDDLELCSRLTGEVDVPALVMTYYTIPDARGLDRFADDAVRVGLAGAILPDLPAGEAGEWLAEARRTGLSTVFLAASVSTDQRLARIAEASSGFVYATSLLGVTGERDSVADARQLVGRIRGHTDGPVAVGIGISTPDQAAEVGSYADGVIVGSAVVRAAGDGDPGGAPQRVGEVVAALRRGVEAARR